LRKIILDMETVIYFIILYMQSLYTSLYAKLIKMSTHLLIIFPLRRLFEIAKIYALKVMSL